MPWLSEVFEVWIFDLLIAILIARMIVMAELVQGPWAIILPP